jgi:hypothetical protein
LAFNTNTGKQSFIATAGQTVIDFNFKIFTETDLLVYQTLSGENPDDVNDLLTLTTDYTVIITGDTGGKVTLVTGAGINDTIVLQRKLPQVRDIEYQTNGDLRAETLNNDQDYQTYLITDNNLVSNNAIRIPDSAINVNTQLDDVMPQYFLRWNTEGTAIENSQAVVQEITQFNQDNFRVFTGTKNIAMSANNITTGQTRTIIMPDNDVDLSLVVPTEDTGRLSGADGLIDGTVVLNGSNQPEVTGTVIGAIGKVNGTYNNFNETLVAEAYTPPMTSDIAWIGRDGLGAFFETIYEPEREGLLYGKLNVLDNRDVYDINTNLWYSTTGSEINTNGSFDTDTDWTKGTGWTISSGEAHKADVGSSSIIQDVTTVIGETYIFSYDLVAFGGVTGSKFVLNGVNQGIFNTALSTYTYEFKAIGTTTSIGVYTENSSASIDNAIVFNKHPTLGTPYTDGRSYIAKVLSSGGVANTVTPLSYATLHGAIVAENITASGVVQLNNNQYIIDFGTVVNNNRYIMDFPILNTLSTDWIVRAEVFANGIWSESGFARESLARGTKGFANAEGIVVQTAFDTVVYLSAYEGGGHGRTTGSELTSALCRVIATYIGEAKDA